MTSNYALVFPGQGSQRVGMLLGLVTLYPGILKSFEEATKVLGFDTLAAVETGVGLEEHVQPLLLTAEVALWREWERLTGQQPRVLAGHSLGEYAALVAAEVVSFEVGLKIVSFREQLMQEAARKIPGGMLAIVGLTEDQLTKLCLESCAAGKFLAIANYNSDQQLVLSGEVEACEEVAIKAKRLGARLVKFLNVRIPSHCQLMEPVVEQFADFLRDLPFERARVSIMTNVDAQLHDQPEQLKELLVQQLYSPVRWSNSVRNMVNLEITTVLECGPGNVLTNLCKKMNGGWEVASLSETDKLAYYSGVLCDNING